MNRMCCDLEVEQRTLGSRGGVGVGDEGANGEGQVNEEASCTPLLSGAAGLTTRVFVFSGKVQRMVSINLCLD